MPSLLIPQAFTLCTYLKNSHSKSDRRFALQLLHLPEVKPRKEDLKNNIKKKQNRKKTAEKI